MTVKDYDISRGNDVKREKEQTSHEKREKSEREKISKKQTLQD